MATTLAGGRHRTPTTRRSRLGAIALSALMLLGLVGIAAGTPASAATVASSVTVKLSSPVQQYKTPISAAAYATVSGKPAAGRIRYFFDGKLAYEARADANGAARWTLQGSIAVGAHKLQVYFLPYGAGIATSATQTTVNVVRAPAVMSVAVPGSKPPFGSWTTMSIAVSGRNIGKATGTVSLSENGRKIGTASLGNGATQIHFQLTSTPGNNVFTVSYSGNAPIAPAARAVRFPTSRAVPSVAITALSGTTSSGQVTVKVGGGPRAATGTVTALVDGRTVSSTSLNSSGSATLALGKMSAGAHAVKVRYAGDPRYVNGVVQKTLTVKAPAPSNPCSSSARACVDLTHNLAWVQQSGRIIYGPVPMLSGRPGYRTPAGTYSVYWKDIDHKSSIFDDAPMPYAVFFNGGVAFHEGSLYVQSHGCIHLSHSEATYFWNALDYGDTVQVFGYAPY